MEITIKQTNSLNQVIKQNGTNWISMATRF